MPRTDRTYTSADILRFIVRNLTVIEREEVINALGTSGEQEIPQEISGALTFTQIFLDVVGLVLGPIDKILDAGELLGDLFNQADIETARGAAAFMSARRDQLQTVLDGIDF